MTAERQKYLQYLDTFEKMFAEKPFLFNHGHPFVPLDEYFRHFIRAAPSYFTRFGTPWGYTLDMLDQFKDRIVWTGSLAQPNGGQSFATLIQVSPLYHIVCQINYSGDDEMMVLNAELWVVDASVIPKFIAENTKFRVRPVDASLGFNPPSKRTPFNGSLVPH